MSFAKTIHSAHIVRTLLLAVLTGSMLFGVSQQADADGRCRRICKNHRPLLARTFRDRHRACRCVPESAECQCLVDVFFLGPNFYLYRYNWHDYLEDHGVCDCGTVNDVTHQISTTVASLDDCQSGECDVVRKTRKRYQYFQERIRCLPEPLPDDFGHDITTPFGQPSERRLLFPNTMPPASACEPHEFTFTNPHTRRLVHVRAFKLNGDLCADTGAGAEFYDSYTDDNTEISDENVLTVLDHPCLFVLKHDGVFYTVITSR